MDESIVIFDTNSYRDLVRGKTRHEISAFMDELLLLQRNKNIISRGAVIVGMEMAAHLRKKSSKAAQECLEALIAFGIHNHDQNGNFQVFPSARLNILHSYLNGVPIDFEENEKNIAGVIASIYKDTDNALELHEEIGTFNNIAIFMEQAEENFGEMLNREVEHLKTSVRESNPGISKKILKKKMLQEINNGSFELNMGYAFLKMLGDQRGLAFADQEYWSRAEDFNTKYPLATGFFRFIIDFIVTADIDMGSKASVKKRRNWLWDFNLCFMLSSHHLSDILLVTGDKGIIEAAQYYGFGSKVMPFNNYFEFLNS